jgi:hypothetical protein
MSIPIRFAASRMIPMYSWLSFNDAVVALRARAECLKRLLVRLAFVSRESDIIAVEFDNHSSLLQPGFVRLHLTRGSGQKVPAE